MTPAEAAALLTIAAAFDNRKPDADAAKAWSLALDGIRFEDARDVVVDHYARGTDWLMPAHVRDGVKRLRSKRITEAPPLTPPPGMDPIETNIWLLRQRERIGNGEPVEDNYGAELKPRNLPDLRALLPKPDDEQEAS